MFCFCLLPTTTYSFHFCDLDFGLVIISCLTGLIDRPRKTILNMEGNNYVLELRPSLYHTIELFLDIHQELSEFVSCRTSTALAEDRFFNVKCHTDALINLYKKYKPKVGTFEIKSMKKLWEWVARDLSNLFRITISATKCENRWKVLERTYKKVVENNNKTGRWLFTFNYYKNLYQKTITKS